MSTKPNPKRGEIWYAELEPKVGAEMGKTRRTVVVSSDSVGVLPIKIIAPLTEWKNSFENNLWHVKVEPNSTNGLTKISAVDILQLHGIDVKRFKNKVGQLSAEEMEEIATAIAAVVEYQ